MAETKTYDGLTWTLRKGGGTGWWIAKVQGSRGVELLLSVSALEYRAHALSTDEDPIEWRVKVQTSYETSNCSVPPSQIAGGRAKTPEDGMSSAKSWLVALVRDLARNVAEVQG